MKFEEFLKIQAKAIEEKQRQLLATFAKEVKKTASTLYPLIQAFIKANQGGKKIRGTLILLGYQIASGKKNEEVLWLAAAYEILHTGILAHDDIIDQSPARRGQPSLYKSVGVSQAITLADLGFFLSIKIIAESNFPDKIKNEAIKQLSGVLIDTTIGQMLDIEKGDVLTVMRLKTAQYTFCGPLQIGAILAGASNKLIKKLAEFGKNLGIAFQIRDDILDEEVTGYTQKEALEYANRARKMITEIAKGDKITNLLEEMTEYLVERRQ